MQWSYDNAHRALSETTNNGVVSYGYNNANQRTAMTAANRAAVNYGYDTAGRLSTINQGVETFTYSYDSLSRRNSLTRPNGVTTNYGYDEVNRLKRLTHSNSFGNIEDLQYSYNVNDEISGINSLNSGTALPAAKTVTPANAANRISQFGNASYQFDNHGQATSKTDGNGTTNYQWDARGRLTKATLPRPALEASASVCGAEPPRSTRFSLPSAKKPTERLSGDQNGNVTPSVPATGCAEAEASDRTHSWEVFPLAAT